VTNSFFSNAQLAKFATFTRVFVGYSGGLDSTVLLHALANEPLLNKKLQAIHVHHGLSVHADAWQVHCEAFCEVLNIPLIVCLVEVNQQSNIEAHARSARYKAFSDLIAAQDCLLLAHHKDDQAETLLLQLLRGAGIDGLAAMPMQKQLPQGKLFRPFLPYSRQQLEAYAKKHRLTWIDDESNLDHEFSRNYLRHHIIPKLKERWPQVVNNLARSASHCQQAKANLEALAAMDCERLNKRTLNVAPLLKLSHARLSNVLRVWLQHNNVRLPSTTIFNRIIDELVLGRMDAAPVVVWQNVKLRRHRETLHLIDEDHARNEPKVWENFPATLSLDNGQVLQPIIADTGLYIPEKSKLDIRFRKGGESFYWHKQTKKLKKLFQEWNIPSWKRDSIPLLYINNDLAAVVGFAISDHYFVRNKTGLYHILISSNQHG
jgi:tRNA(Ile)-lysidine synthase